MAAVCRAQGNGRAGPNARTAAGAAFAGAAVARAARQRSTTRWPKPNAATAPMTAPWPETSATRVARRPAPLPTSRQSPQESPMTDSSSSAASAAAPIASGNSIPPKPRFCTWRSSSQPTMPPAPAGSVIGCAGSTAQAKAPSSSAGITIDRRRGIRRSGRCSSRRNAQPSTISGSRNAARPSACTSRSATSAPSRPRKLCGVASTAVLKDGSAGS